MAASGGRERRRLSVDRELQVVGNNWTVNGQGLEGVRPGSEDGEMDVGQGSLEKWKVVVKKKNGKLKIETIQIMVTSIRK